MDLGFLFLSLWRTPQSTAFSAQKRSTNVSWTVAILCSGGGQNNVGVCTAIKMQFIEVGKNDTWAWKMFNTLSSLRFFQFFAFSCPGFWNPVDLLCFLEAIVYQWVSDCDITNLSPYRVAVPYTELRRNPIEETTSLLPKEKWISYCSFEDAGMDHL